MKRILFLLLLVAPLALLLAVTGRRAAPVSGLQTVFTTSVEQGDDAFSVVRVTFSPQQVDLVRGFSGWKEPWEIDYDKGFFVVEATADEIAWLETLGLQVDIDQALTTLYNTPNVPLEDQGGGIPGYACYRTVEETFATAAGLVSAYPQLAQWQDVGDTWEKTQNGAAGYDMNVLVLTNSAIPGPKPVLFATTSIHAREYTPAELGTRFAEYLVANYGSDPDATWILDHHEVHLLLMANPDGRKFAEQGFSWRKNTNENYCSPTSSSRGADLNRNFEFQWGCCGGSSGSQCDLTYRGPSPASEPEVQAIQDYGLAIFDDQRLPDLGASAPLTTTGIYLDIHSYSELVLWPWGFTAAAAGNGPQLQTLGRKLAYFNGYEPVQAIGLYPTDGTTDDFFYGELGVASYTFELGTAFRQSCGTFENTILPDNLEALLYTAKAVRAPYLLGAGPDVTSLALSNGVVAAGTAVTLTAAVDDTRYENQNGVEPTQPIAAAEVYIDTPYWITTTLPVAYPLSAADGSFDSSSEAVTGVIDTTSLAQGRHLLYVRGQDADGNWGVISALFLDIIDPDVAPVIQGTVTELGSGLPLEAAVSSSAFQIQSDPLTGAYSAQVISGTYAVTASRDGYASSSALVSASDFQTVTQDFVLAPYLTVLEDTVEFGPGGWTAQAPWAITTETSQSPTHSWTDSPGGNYGNNRNVSLTSPVVDLGLYGSVSLNFWQICDTEAGYDYCIVEARADSGEPWTELARFDGPSSSWEEVALNATVIACSPTAQFRFRLTSDQSEIRDGWHVDDIVLRGASSGCANHRIYLPAASSD